MRVRLEVSHNKANVPQVVLRSDTLIGRSPDCNLRILSTEVSRRHCRIIVMDDAVLVRDLGSSNGTFIDGIQLEPETDVAIPPGSQLSVAGVKFIVHFEPDSRPPGVVRSGSPASTIDYVPPGRTDARDQPSGASPPRPAGTARSAAPSRDTVQNHPAETVRDAASRTPDPGRAPKRNPLAEPPTEFFGGLPPSILDEDADEATVLEFLPDWDVDANSQATRPG